MRDRRKSRLALVTGDFIDLADLERRVRPALEGGVRWVQLRAKPLSAGELLQAATLLRELTRRFDALLVVNDRIDVALAAGADGVHLPGGGLAPHDARRLLGGDRLLGLSVHSCREIEAAAGAGLDYVQFGPVYETPSKRAFGPPQGLEALREAARSAHSSGLWLVAIGGFDVQRAGDAGAAGSDAVAVIGAIWDAPDIRAAAQRLSAAAQTTWARATAQRL